MNAFLTATGLTKSYPGVKALSDARLTLQAGSIHALLGENGAGKSTLVKILTGVHTADAGKISLEGKTVQFSNPVESARAGIGVVHQERNVVPLFSVAENITLQNPPQRFGFVDRAKREALVREVLNTLNLDIEPSTIVSELAVAQVQLVEIGKALALDSRVLILDEPTASLTENETVRLFEVLRRLRDDGAAIVFVSHKLEEVFALCDTVTVLRDGVTVVDAQPLTNFKPREIVNLMVGRELAERDIRMRNVDRSRTPRLQLTGVSTELGHRNIDLEVARGEILGLYGLVGAGRSELARSILGISRIIEGSVIIDGQAVAIKSVEDALNRYGMGYVTEDRKNEGLFLGMTVRYNVAATIWRRISGWLGVRSKEEMGLAAEAIADLSIKVSSDQQLVGQLSGGNQQKVSLGKWLVARTQILIIDEPTVGVDVRTKEDFQQIIMDLADSGVTILLIDSDMPEMITLADRIAVMNDYRLVGTIDNSKNYATMSSALIELIHSATVNK
ncbi:MAG: sugar ABC transporter ATP-binding protein [Microbacteriaceae bacterium]